MADQGSAEQLLELLIQLKRTTPQAARDILNGQPAIAYALITLMVSIGAINIEVFQKILAQFHETAGRGQTQPPLSNIPSMPPTTSTPPISTLPPHLQAQYRTTTPPVPVPTPPTAAPFGYPGQQGYPPPPQGYGQSSNPPPGAYGYPHQQAPAYPGYSPPVPGPSSQGYAVPTPQAARPPGPAAIKAEMLAGIPEEQRALIMHVVSMTQEQLNNLPPEQRDTYIQIRQTLGIH